MDKPSPPKKFQPSNANMLAWSKLVKALVEGDCRSSDLVTVTGLSRLTVYKYLKALRRQGAAHICSYDRDARGQDKWMVWRLGPGKDAQPRKQSPEEKNRKMRERLQILRLMAVVKKEKRDDNSATQPTA